MGALRTYQEEQTAKGADDCHCRGNCHAFCHVEFQWQIRCVHLHVQAWSPKLISTVGRISRTFRSYLALHSLLTITSGHKAKIISQVRLFSDTCVVNSHRVKGSGHGGQVIADGDDHKHPSWKLQSQADDCEEKENRENEARCYSCIEFDF